MTNLKREPMRLSAAVLHAARQPFQQLWGKQGVGYGVKFAYLLVRPYFKVEIIVLVWLLNQITDEVLYIWDDKNSPKRTFTILGLSQMKRLPRKERLRKLATQLRSWL